MATESETGVIGSLIGIAVVVVLGLWVYNHWIKTEWVPLREASDGSIQAGKTFGNGEECVEYARINGYSECGKNCEPPKTPIGVYRCDETLD